MLYSNISRIYKAMEALGYRKRNQDEKQQLVLRQEICLNMELSKSHSIGRWLEVSNYYHNYYKQSSRYITFFPTKTLFLDRLFTIKPRPASVAQLDAPSDWRPGGRGFNPRQGRQHSFVEIDQEIFSTVILSLPLIQEGQLSVSGERMCTIMVNRLED